MTRSDSREAARCSTISMDFSAKRQVAATSRVEVVDMEKGFAGILATILDDILGSAFAPIIVDVRSNDEVHAVDRLITGAIHRPSDDVQGWWHDLPSGRGAVVGDLF